MTEIKVYELGSIPADPIVISLKDERGNPLDLTPYPNVQLRMVGSNNEEVDLTGSATVVQERRNGRVLFVFPRDRSLFTRTGDYVFDLELSGEGVRDFTTFKTIRVTKLGGVR